MRGTFAVGPAEFVSSHFVQQDAVWRPHYPSNELFHQTDKAERFETARPRIRV